MTTPVRIIASAQVDVMDLAVAGCDDDIHNLLRRFEARGVSMRGQSVMIPPFATARQFHSDMLHAADEAARSPGITVIIYSGHGGRVPDDNGDEPHGWFKKGYDSTLCFCDRPMRDDEVGQLLAAFPSTEWVYFLCDSCHSGTMYRDRPRVYHGFAFRKSASITCRLAYFGGCQDKGYSMGYKIGGAATLDLCAAMDDGAGTVREWYEAAKRRTVERGEGQEPSIVFFNDGDGQLQGSALFTKGATS